MTEVEQPPQNGIDLSAAEDEESSKARPADIEQDMREMERRKRVEAIMGSKLFREELERIVDCARDSGNAAGILQQLSDIVGVPSSRVGSVFKTSTCMLPINDIRGVESMGYAKGEKILRCKLAATFRLLDLYGWTQGLGAQITARLKVDQEYFLVNPFGLLYHEITASSLNKVDMQGNIVEQGTTNFGVNKSHFVLHSVVHAARPDIRCAIYIGCSPVVAISSLKTGLLPLTKDACVLGELTTYSYTGYLHDEEERNKLVRNLGPNSKVMLLTNHGALCCGETIEEAFFAACHIVQACETQLKLLPVGLDNLVLIPEESRKIIYDQSRRPPEDLEKKFAAATITDSNKSEEEKKEVVETTTKVIGQAPKWRVGGAEFEALMRMLDNAGYRTGYIYRHPLIKSDPPKPKNDVELPPAVSSLGYLLEEEELFRQGIWKKGDLRKGGDRSRWLNSPNVYQKVEVLETGTPDPKKITKWVAEGSPTHSTPVRIDDPLQFVPVNTNPKEFKRVQQQIKDNRRADKISAGPQSHILEGVTWDEANRIKDATVSSAGDHVVLMGAASKGIIQRGFQHNATVYKAPYAKNPFDNVTDDELNEYKRTVERKKKSIHGEYTDTDFSESEALSSLQTSGAQQQTKQTTTTTTTTTAAVSQSEPEDISEHQVMRIQTEQAPVPSQPEVVLSDDSTQSYKTLTLSVSLPKYYKICESFDKLEEKNLSKKYSFLYNQSWWSPLSLKRSQMLLYMIHKIEIYPHYTYPIISHNVVEPVAGNDEQNIINGLNVMMIREDDQILDDKPKLDTTNLLPPYRTVSHYGFNYPSTYIPNISMHPVCSITPVNLQRQKVIAFIKRLNLEANTHEQQLSYSNKTAVSTNVESDTKTGKEANIYENTKSCDDKTEVAGSFISVAEIQLNTAKEKNGSKEITNHQDTHLHFRNRVNHNHNNQGDLQSNQFPSLLSISETYPAATHSHIGDAENDHFTTDSGDNSSNFELQSTRKTTHDNLYRTYLQRNFIPEVINSHQSIMDFGIGDEEHDPHKPESEQRSHNNMKHSSKYVRNDEDKHVTLTLNSLKRRASSFCDKKEKSRTHDKPLLTRTSFRTQFSDANSSCDSSTASTAIEIHINVNIRNSDCVKKLQNHEQEFKTKLEKVIDDEINLITQELATSSQCEKELKNITAFHLNPSHRCLSAPESVFLYGRDQSCIEADRHSLFNFNESVMTTPLRTLSAIPPNLYTMRYRQTLAMLEQELEILLNSIIRNMCDCKTKISQISEDIRTATLHVGSLNPTTSNKERETN
ncbi:protein hu-li tai shao isoform X1 [Lucilia sericata]|uniref:protein hu-li tai shao isoform X1 n=1 Tax=Lucilia sericata TaxID=13632 RepID=UPI0018A824A6|nr:protein hu-li tai shao isoform X1 [Lucilia sericata]XP_037806021.1 protein hu-li tai shao isoform X1 [Lucilia sericata]XP_037806022.1 protein hu-li tai shao isoform X1 [Lucilia sericata]XP_037806023.1 protein hu-li tai shao isoform X1 [Lucilia sericata]